MLAAALLVLIALQVSAAAEEESKQSESAGAAGAAVPDSEPTPGYMYLYRKLRVPNWQPSLAVTSGVTFQLQQGQASSTIDATGRLGVMPGDELAKPGKGEDWAVSPYVGINAELMTPEIAGGIRFFVNGEYLPTFGADLDVEKVGDPSGLEVPPAPFFEEVFCDPSTPPPGSSPFGPGCNCPYGFGCYSEAAITGAGSRTTATVGLDVFGAAIGVALPFELFGRKLTLKPSFGWIRYSVEVDGAVLRAIKVDADTGAENLPQFRPLPVVRFVELSDSSTGVFNAIGPGLELEMQVHQVGPVEASLFLDAHGYRVLGNREVKLSDTTTRSCDADPVIIQPPPNFNLQTALCKVSGTLGTVAFNQFGVQEGKYSADWSFKVDPWLYRVGIGLRLRWTGE